MCSVQFWLLVSRGNRLKALTFWDLLTVQIVWFTHAEPSSTSANEAVVSLRRSALGIPRMRFARSVFTLSRRDHSAALTLFRCRNGSLRVRVWMDTF